MPLGNLLQLTNPSNNVTSWTYDAHGNRLSETNALGTRTFAYDADDRLVSATDRNGRVRSFDYDAEGRLTDEDWLDSVGMWLIQLTTLTMAKAGSPPHRIVNRRSLIHMTPTASSMS